MASRDEQYLELIQALLDCESGRENEILQENIALLDRDFVLMTLAVARNAAEQGEDNAARFLENLAQQVTTALGIELPQPPLKSGENQEDYGAFLQEVLRAEYESNSDPKVVFPVLRKYEHLLDENFGQLLRNWLLDSCSTASPEQKDALVGLVENLAIDIKNFPLGRRWDNLEIAIMGYETVLELRPRHQYAELWAQTQNNLATAYSGRLRGDRAENIEEAIAAYQLALEVYTRADFREYWAGTQNNLATAYSERLRGDRAANIDNWTRPYLFNKSAWTKNFNQTLSDLAQKLQLNQLIGDRLTQIQELILIPHLLLHTLPLHALPISKDPRLLEEVGDLGTDPQTLGDQFQIRVINSCQTLHLIQQNHQPPTQTQYGIIENATEDLLFTPYECAHIQQLHNVSPTNHLKKRTQATTDNYKKLLKHTTHLHSSHHAQSRFDNPLQSALLLGDGIITLADLMTPAYRNPDLQEIFLSCCETGLGVNLELADEPLSLATGFFYAGAKTVISTLWSVSDLATALFTILYYNARHKGETAPAALQTAQQQLRILTLDQWQKIAPDLYQVTIIHRDEFIAGLNHKIEALKIKIFDLKTELKHHPKDSQEYKEITEQRTNLANQQNHLRDQIQFFETLPNTEKPFTHPQYWAAFVCQGITIDPPISPQKTNPISQSIFSFNRTLNP